MRCSIVVMVLLAACGPSQREICERGAHMRDPGFDPKTEPIDAFYAACMKEKWSDKQVDCVLRTGFGTLQMMFCFEPK